jgi:hypothetical protein
VADVPKQIDRGPAGEEDPGKVTGAVTGAAGAAAGVGLGALLGPAGMIVGGLAGAVGGWWAGREVAEAAGDFDDETDAHYRSLHAEQHAGTCDYDDARCYYQLGHVARRNPDYDGREFDEIEPELRRGWSDGHASDRRFRSWDDVRPFVRTGYSGGRQIH